MLKCSLKLTRFKYAVCRNKQLEDDAVHENLKFEGIGKYARQQNFSRSSFPFSQSSAKTILNCSRKSHAAASLRSIVALKHRRRFRRLELFKEIGVADVRKEAASCEFREQFRILVAIRSENENELLAKFC